MLAAEKRSSRQSQPRGDADLSKRVSGQHTDSKPLKGGPYQDNWGLSAMRARSCSRT
jgi:flagellar motor protein MotB